MVLTTQQVAARLGVSPRAVRALASRYNIGTMLTDRQRVYSETDVAHLAERVGKVGRPKAS